MPQFKSESLRERANKLLAQDTKTPPQTKEELAALFHELKVYEMELELQNQELLNTQMLLENSLDQYVDLYDFAPLGYVTLDKQGTIHKCNLMASSMLRTDRNMIQNKPLAHFCTDSDALFKHCYGVINTNKSAQCEIQMKRYDGSLFWARLESVPELDNKEVVYCRTAISDISSLKKLQEELEHTVEEKDKALTTRERFLANTSHEIRTPLNGIMGLLEVMLLSDPTDEMKKNIDLALSSADYLLSMINDLLDISQIDANKLTITESPFDLYKCLQGIYELLKPKIEQKNLTFNLNIDKDLIPTIIGDEGRLRQILINLLGNATKFTSSGSITFAVKRLSTDHIKQYIRFDIIDSGIGISDAHQGKLFKPFYQIDNSDSRIYNGNGLGLTISKRLTESMHGKITFQSKHGEGTTFSVFLSFKTDTSFNSANEQKITTIKTDHTRKQTEDKHILLVDDDRVTRHATHAILSSLGYQSTAVSNGYEAVCLAKKENFQIILMDINMPVLNGFETTQKIRELRNENLFIIGLTADVTKETTQKGLISGMDHVLLKPCRKNTLKELLAKFESKTRDLE